MYCDFYQLTERPFNVTPDPKFLYLNARYREAIASLHYGITQRRGFITLIGEAGTGKTTLLKKILEDLDQKTKTVFIFNTNVTFEEILEYIFAEFDLPVLNGKKLYMLQRLNTFLLEELRGGGNVALLIDEAQDLEFSVLEDLRLLSNLETAKEKILQIVLSGQPELGQKLSNPMLRQLRQRIGINCRLPPLSRDEVTEYIHYRLQATHCPDPDLFSREAEDQIFRFSRGIPRLVNVVSDNALVIGYALGRKRIDADIVAEAAADLMSVETQLGEVTEQPFTVSATPDPPPLPSSWRARLGVAGVVLVVTLLGVLSIGRTMLNKRVEEQVAQTRAAVPLEVIRPGSEPRGTGVAYPSAAGNAALEQPGRTEADSKLPPANDSAAAEDAPATSIGRRADPAERDPATAQKSVAPTQDVGEPHALSKSELLVANAHAASMPEAARPRPGAAVPTSEPGVSGQEAAVSKADVTRGKLDEEPTDIDSALAGTAPHIDQAQFTPVVAQVGDSISAIARREYGQASYTILDLLELANPELPDLDTISVGQTIRLPSLAAGFPILTDGSGHYALLVLSTPQQRRGAALRRTLRSRGFPARVIAGSAGLGRPLYRVVIPATAGRDALVETGRQVQQAFREDKRLAQLGD
jgi:general secretion pathway protein A